MKTITFKLEEFKAFLSDIQERDYGLCDHIFYGHFRITENGEIYEDWDTIESDKIRWTDKKLKGEVKEE